MAGLLFSACLGPGKAVVLDGGSARLNPALRHDFGPNPGTTRPGRFFGACELPPDFPSGDCDLIDPLVIRSVSPEHLRRLRRAPYFWVGGGPGNSARLTYEWVADGVRLVNRASGAVEVGDVNLGSCINFAELEERTRQRVRNMNGQVLRVPPVADLDQVLAVILQSCRTPGQAARVSEILEPITGACDGVDVKLLRDSAASWSPRPQELWPVCVKDLPFVLSEGDTRHELVLQARADVNRLWRHARFQSQPLSPQLMVVPVGGTRTISRRMAWSRNIQVEDGPEAVRFEFQVPLVGASTASPPPDRLPADGSEWLENFSPNVVVAQVRIRRGPWREGGVPEYLPIHRLRIGETLCLTRTDRPGVDEFDIMLCRIGDAELVPMTPTYRLDQFHQNRVDDGRLTWQADVFGPPGGPPVMPTDPVFIEFDLTALDDVSSARSGLTAAPPVQNFGTLRVGSASPPRWAARVQNVDASGVRIDRIEVTGRSASEFGAPRVKRLGGPAYASAPAEPVLPLPLPAYSAIDVFLLPAVVGNETKEAQLTVYFTGVSNRQDRISVMLRAAAASPDLDVLPKRLIMTFEGRLGHATVTRAFLVQNIGYAAGERRGIRIEGPDHAHFALAPERNGMTLEELQRPRMIESGSDEILHVTYRPRAPGSHAAVIVVDTADGPLRVELAGMCVGYCLQPIEVDSRLTPADRLDVEVERRPAPGRDP